MGRCIIVGAGEFNAKFLKIEQDDYIIAADGGYEHLKKEHIKPDILIGDMDSVKKQVKGISVIQLPCEKDDTDTLAAIRLGLEKGYHEFILHGMLGGRIDHTIANIQCLQFLKKNDAHGVLYGKDSYIQLIHNERLDFPDTMQGTVSVFSISEEAKGVTETGLKYSLENEMLSGSFPIGISNEFTGEASSISVQEGSLLVCVVLSNQGDLWSESVGNKGKRIHKK